MGKQMDKSFVSDHIVVPSSRNFDVAHTTLLVIDMQTGFIDPQEQLSMSMAMDIIPQVNSIIKAFRDAGSLIIFTRHTITDEGPRSMPDWLKNDPWMKVVDPLLRPGMPSHALHSRINVAPSDTVIDKFRASAFNRLSSNLEEVLVGKGIETIIVIGCTTNICCESTARDGHMLGYRTIVVSDAMAARTAAEHEASLLNLSAAFADVLDTADLIESVRQYCLKAG